MTEKGKRKKRRGKEACMIPSEAGNHWIRRRASNEAGQVLIITVLALVVLIASLALATDVGFWRYMRRNMQKAADAGAIAGATETLHNPSLIDNAAKADTSKNGFTHNEKGVIVEVYNPPSSGPHKDLPEALNYVEVIIKQDQPTFFAKIFNITSQRVSARAVARAGLTNGDGCVYVLNQHESNALMAYGAAHVKAECNVCVNSDNDPAMSAGGGPPFDPTYVEAAGITVVGTYREHGNGYFDPKPVQRGGSLCEDPLFGLEPPDRAEYPECDETDLKVFDNTTLSPGRYCGGIDVLGGTVEFEPGLYYLDGGGLHNAAGSTLISQEGGVTFYNYGTGASTDGDISINGNSNTDLKAPTEGDYKGVLFFQDPNNTKDATFNGNSDTNMLGALYFPSALATFNGQNDTTAGYTMIIADTVKFTGGATFNIGNDAAGSNNPPITKVQLVE